MREKGEKGEKGERETGGRGGGAVDKSREERGKRRT